MIRCQYVRRNHMISISGHAGYAPKGQDIVCAGVSAIEYSLIKWLDTMAVEGIESKVVTGDDDCIVCHDERADACMQMAWLGLCAIAENYPDNVVCMGG